VAEQATALRPGEFCRMALRALDAAEGQTRRRKRDQRPDHIGLGIKRDLLERAADQDPPSDDFESWLMAQVLSAPAGGPVRAMGVQILEEFRFAALDSGLDRWFRQGAPSDDAALGAPKGDAEIMRGAEQWDFGPPCCLDEGRLDSEEDWARRQRSRQRDEGRLESS
jgi:hypothetical protein